MAKAKKRAEKYDPKLKIKGTFSDVIKVAMTEPPSAPVKAAKKAKKKKK